MGKRGASDTLESPVKKVNLEPNVSSLDNSLEKKEECAACGDLRWWCRGCGGFYKREALKDQGYSEELTETIIHYQFGCCSLPYFPCFLCNRDGTKPKSSKMPAGRCIPSAWVGFK